ncbi:sulfotransferase family 2 domain-containing protein [Cognatishimia sp.]|uniref:sulfotransferase family 2 domain-containing protein n=1 Tax=Cognatishimia sp. TaxID=2211648 RepID=UPI003516BBB5|nr:sulfotransferase family 2 domain-containing protein [Cognatishimia sp.]
MIISHGRRYIFVHIPKTAGTAMALALEGRAMKDDLMLGDTPKALKRRRRLKDVQAAGRLWKHSTLSDIEGLVCAEEIGSYFTFTLVRNPWDRMVSYYHWLKDQIFAHPAVTLAQELEFQGFAQHPQTMKSFRSNPYASYLTFRGQERASCFIRIENFEEDAQPLFDHLGFSLSLSRVNASERKADYRAYYDEKTSAAVAEACAEDITRFKYSF